jgi:hypothetical protein
MTLRGTQSNPNVNFGGIRVTLEDSVLIGILRNSIPSGIDLAAYPAGDEACLLHRFHRLGIPHEGIPDQPAAQVLCHDH